MQSGSLTPGMDQATFDEGARTFSWLQPGERIWWRGVPSSHLLVPSDALVVPVYAVAILAATLTSGSGVLGLSWPLQAVGAVWFLRRFVRQPYVKRRRWYAVTSQRAVVIGPRGRILRQTPVGTPATFGRIARSDRGTVVFSPLDAAPRASWPWPRTTPAEVAFVDLDDVEDVASQLRRLGVRVSDGAVAETASGPSVLLPWPRRRYQQGSVWSVPPVAPPPGIGRLRWWIRSRLKGHAYTLYSPLPPSEVLARLQGGLHPLRGIAALRSRLPTPRGEVFGMGFNIEGPGSKGGPFQHWYEGSVVAADGPGSWFLGREGPKDSVPTFGPIWVGVVFLFFVAGLIGLGMAISLGKTGQIPFLLPFVLIPSVMLSVFFGGAEYCFRAAEANRPAFERWLYELVQARPASPEQAPGAPQPVSTPPGTSSSG
jgi:hypothetical protein